MNPQQTAGIPPPAQDTNPPPLVTLLSKTADLTLTETATETYPAPPVPASNVAKRVISRANVQRAAALLPHPLVPATNAAKEVIFPANAPKMVVDPAEMVETADPAVIAVSNAVNLAIFPETARTAAAVAVIAAPSHREEGIEIAMVAPTTSVSNLVKLELDCLR